MKRLVIMNARAFVARAYLAQMVLYIKIRKHCIDATTDITDTHRPLLPIKTFTVYKLKPAPYNQKTRKTIRSFR